MALCYEQERGAPVLPLPPPPPPSVVTPTSTSPHQLRRRVRVTRQLDRDIYLGQMWMKDENDNDASCSFSEREVVLKTGGQLQRTAEGKFVGPWREWYVAHQLKALGGHRNVVTFYDSYMQPDGHVCFVMEHCCDGDLLSYLLTQPQNRLPQHEALRLFLQIARGVDFLHRNNIAHRDLSLENIFLCDGVAKIGDFGLSTPAHTSATGCVGKTQYVAPEVVSNPKRYDPVQADIWSLGIILFMMLTGAPLVPFASSKTPEFRAVQTLGCRGVLKLWQLDGLFSFATVDMLATLLQCDPAKRFQTLEQVLNHPALLAAAQREAKVEELSP